MEPYEEHKSITIIQEEHEIEEEEVNFEELIGDIILEDRNLNLDYEELFSDDEINLEVASDEQDVNEAQLIEGDAQEDFNDEEEQLKSSAIDENEREEQEVLVEDDEEIEIMDMSRDTRRWLRSEETRRFLSFLQFETGSRNGLEFLVEHQLVRKPRCTDCLVDEEPKQMNLQAFTSCEDRCVYRCTRCKK